ncbi:MULTISPECIES: threonine ammonia-lyase, biosynthetic [unclassified Oleiphilus]|nr:MULTISPECIES: threonine ammonia-lyase, biosynthetic [unclassified Oleiphilus]KZY65287.1 PLP-dependent threonine dehydratase [Oleiphilus sp. HI0066]KZY68493.1 PLP-dependent threonine dehydratase [Oleiphilus sp. HI0067]MCH2158226.1 threonine ammonia-lyase, biosynthetic [Oleiphilaceae bacterium]
MLNKYIKKILDARVYDVAIESPLTHARSLSQRLGNQVHLKREDLQPVFSFKLRGAYNRVRQLSDEDKAKGVIAASAGNHAQGLALAAKTLGIKATIVMPKTTPEIKVSSVRARGAKVVLVGDTFDEASAYAQEQVAEKGLVYIPPYDDEDVIAGQGTVAMELLKQHPDKAHAVFIPCGGGGLIAGMAAYIKYLRPDIKVIGVEPEDAACLQAAMKSGKRVVLDQVGIFADGVAVRQIGKLPWDVCKDHVDDVITVTTDEICAAIKDIFDDTRGIAEPAGAIGVAGLKKYVEQTNVEGENLLTVVSGANMNFDRMRYISERTEIGEKREAILAVTLPEKPGSYKKFIKALHRRNITEFNYRYTDGSDAQIFVGVQTSGVEGERVQLVEELEEQGYPVMDLTDNEVAKLHVRHMVGGPSNAENEQVFRFQFPERPGALMKFLTSLGSKWNISMFHYRNHGAAYSRVFMGVQVSEEEKPTFLAMLDEIGFPYWDESDNPAYLQFLRAK